MFLARENAEWQRFASLMSLTAAKAWSPERIHPRRLNPYYRDPPQTDEQRAARSRSLHLHLRLGLQAMVRGYVNQR